MRSIKRTIFLIIGFVLLGSSVWGDSGSYLDYNSPENILKFAEYLYQEGDYLRAAGEYQRYLFYSPENVDSALYKIGLCYRRAGNTEKAISFFQRITAKGSGGSFRFAASYQIAYSYFLSGHYNDSLQFIKQALVETGNTDERGQLQILSAFNYMHQRRWRDAELMSGSLTLNNEGLNFTASALRARAREGMNLPRRNPILAGLFSTAIPGTGRIYCKQYGDGIFSFVLISTAALLAWDSFRDNNIRSVGGWLFGGISAVFYAGNVYGSVIAARIYNRQLEADLLERLPVVPDS